MESTYFKRFRMEVPLAGFCGAAQLPAGYRFVPWSEGILDVHARTKHRSFRGEIDSQVFPCLGNLEGCRRLMREIRNKPGFLPQATWLVAWGDSAAELEWCGTIQGVADRGRGGMIQNVGVVPGHRGRGLGSCLIARALEGFRGQGLSSGSLEVTADNGGAVRLYQRLGFRRTRTIYKATDAVEAAIAAAEAAASACDPELAACDLSATATS